MRRKNAPIWTFFTLLILAVFLIFVVYPLILILYKSVINPADNSLTFENFTRFFTRKYYVNTLTNSFKVTIVATLISATLGLLMAYITRQVRIAGSKWLNILIVVSYLSPPFIGAYAWIQLLGRNGLITKVLNALLGIEFPGIYGFAGIVLVFSLQSFPLVYMYVCGALENLDNSLNEAAESLGASNFQRVTGIILPLVMPTVLASSLLVFMRVFSDFGTPMLIGEGYRTFPVILYTEFVGEVSQNKGFASAIAVIAIIITTVVFFGQNYISKRKSFSMNSLHPIEEKPLHGLKSVLIHLFCYVVVGIAILPQVYVIYTSFKKTSGTIYVEGYSLDSYISMFTRLGNSVQNTIVIPVISLIAVVLLAVLIAYLSVRRRNVLSGTVDVMSMVPYIIPGTVVGIAMVTSFNQKPLAFTGTVFIMVVALVVRRLPYTIRSSVAILHQIPITIEEAALSLGSTKMKTFFRITVPMMSSGIVAGAILSWVTMISELSTAMILYTGRTQTLTVAVYTQIIRGNYGIAAAMASVLTILTIISLLIFNRLSKNGEITM